MIKNQDLKEKKNYIEINNIPVEDSISGLYLVWSGIISNIQ